MAPKEQAQKDLGAIEIAQLEDVINISVPGVTAPIRLNRILRTPIVMVSDLYCGADFGGKTFGAWLFDEIPSLPDEPKGVFTMRKYKIMLETKVIPAWREVTSEEEQQTSWFQTEFDLDQHVLKYLRSVFEERIFILDPK